MHFDDVEKFNPLRSLSFVSSGSKWTCPFRASGMCHSSESGRDKNRSLKVQPTRLHGEGPPTEVISKDTTLEEKKGEDKRCRMPREISYRFTIIE